MTEENPAPKVTRKDQLVQVALTVLERDGFAHLSIGEVARLAGIKPPSLYKQFESKADIEVSLIAHGLAVLGQQLRASVDEVPADATYRERIERLCSALRTFGLEHPQLYLLMNSRPFPAETLGPATEQPSTRVLLEVIGDDLVGSGVWTWAHGILSLEIVSQSPQLVSSDALWATLVDYVVDRHEVR